MPVVEDVHHSVCRTDDFEELQQAASAWDQEYMQISPGRFYGGFRLTEVGSTQILQERWSHGLRYRGLGVPNSYSFALPLVSSAPAAWLGSPLESSSVVMQSPYLEGELISGDEWELLAFAFEEQDVRFILRSLTGGLDLTHMLRGSINLKPEDADRIKRLGLDFLNSTSANAAEDHAVHSAQADQFKKLFLWALIEAFENSDAQDRPTDKWIIVRQATDLISTETGNPLGLTEICRQLGVSLRTLNYAFHSVTGMPPAAWLRNARLNQVHKVLKNASPENLKIKRVAAQHGFFHLGHFSARYRRMFGRLPSETLRMT